MVRGNELGLVHGAQWGRDLVFTYGPLSFLSQHFSYFPATFSLATFGQLLLVALYLFVFITSLHPIHLWVGLIFLLGLIAFGNFLAGDVLFATTFVLGLLALLRSESMRPAPALLLLLATGILVTLPWLAKFSFFPLWLVWQLAVLCTSVPLRNRLILVGAAIAAASSLWLLAGQSLIAIPDYLTTSWYIVSGYGSGMQRPLATGSTQPVLQRCSLRLVSPHGSPLDLRRRCETASRWR